MFLHVQNAEPVLCAFCIGAKIGFWIEIAYYKTQSKLKSSPSKFLDLIPILPKLVRFFSVSVYKQKPRSRLLLFLNMATVYILHSKSAGEFYTGSSKDAEQRYDYHVLKEFPGTYTAKYDDWEPFFQIDNLEIGLAKKIESHIKRMKSQVYIRNLAKYPEMVEKLVARYR